jgi:hypothetical protein
MLVDNIFVLVFLFSSASMAYLWIDMALTAKRLSMKGGWLELYVEFNKKLSLLSHSKLDNYTGAERDMVKEFYVRAAMCFAVLVVSIVGGALLTTLLPM